VRGGADGEEVGGLAPIVRWRFGTGTCRGESEIQEIEIMANKDLDRLLREAIERAKDESSQRECSLDGDVRKDVAKGPVAREECEMLPKCGFFKKYQAVKDLACRGFIRMYCRGPKMEECVRKQYRVKHGVPPSDDMMPSGQTIVLRYNVPDWTTVSQTDGYSWESMPTQPKDPTK
jgi:hypothetical protein